MRCGAVAVALVLVLVIILDALRCRSAGVAHVAAVAVNVATSTIYYPRTSNAPRASARK